LSINSESLNEARTEDDRTSFSKSNAVLTDTKINLFSSHGVEA